MIGLGLSRSQLDAFHQALADSHYVGIDVDVLNPDGDELSRLAASVVDGQVDVDAAADVTRTASVTFYDPDRSLSLDPDSAADGALFMNRQLRITYRVISSRLGVNVGVPVFTGPVVAVTRTADQVSVECQGVEALAGAGGNGQVAWLPMTIRKGTPKVTAIRRVLAERGGQTRFDLPDLQPRLPTHKSLGRESVPWEMAQRIARSLDARQLFADGRGIIRLRHKPGRVFTFRTDAIITSPPALSYSLDGVRNVVAVKGGKPKGVQTDTDPSTDTPARVPGVRAAAVAQRSHPLSPQRLGRGGVPRFLVEFVDDSYIRTVAEARRVANRRLDDLLAQHVSASFEALPVPHLEPLDMVRVVADLGSFNMRIQSFSLPLRVGSPMTVNQTRRVASRGHR